MKNMRKILAITLVVMSILGIAASASAAVAYGVCNTKQYISVRSGPSTGYDRIYALRNGQPVETTSSSSNGFTKITAPISGWIMTSYISTGTPGWITRYSSANVDRAEKKYILHFQEDVNKTSYSTTIKEDGVYGNQCREAVRWIQQKGGLTVDLIPGTMTKVWLYNLSH